MKNINSLTLKTFLVGICFLSLSLNSETSAQSVDTEGRLTTSNWMILGPFRQPKGCGNSTEELLENYIAPTGMVCLTPEVGDELEYDSFLASSSGYEGPLSDLFLPVWRVFDDSSEDGFQDLSNDPGNTCASGEDGVCQNFLSYLVTYIEYTGEAEKNIELCFMINGGVKVWLDEDMIFARSGCDKPSECVRIPVTISKGAHRIAIASFTAEESARMSLSMFDGELKVLPSHPDWTFHGKERPESMGNLPCPELTSPIKSLACQLGEDGKFNLTWENPFDANQDQVIELSLNGETINSFLGDTTEHSIPAEDFDLKEGLRACLLNQSGHEVCCELEPYSPVTQLGCSGGPNGSLQVVWKNPDHAIASSPIWVFLDGDLIQQLEGTIEQTVIPRETLEGTVEQVCIQNESDQEVCCESGMTDTQGRIRGQAWLALGPYQFQVECNGRDLSDRLLENFVAPSSIVCQYPQAGDPMPYNVNAAFSTAYWGPLDLDNRPVWRFFDDGTTEDSDLNFRADAGHADVISSPDGQMGFVATYIEYLGAEPAEVTLCLGIGDSGQVWFDDQLVFNRYECGERMDCEYQVELPVQPGVHRILIGVFNAFDDWGARVSLRRNGEPILDLPEAFSEWVFLGRVKPDVNFPCSTGVPEQCGNGEDDDGDTLYDCEDPDCFEAAECHARPVFKRGDVDGNGKLELTDPINNLSYQFLGTFQTDCLDALDFDDNGRIELTDPISNLSFQFLGTAPPAPPGKDSCGTDWSDDEVGCEVSHTNCN